MSNNRTQARGLHQAGRVDLVASAQVLPFFELVDRLCGIFHREGIAGGGWAGNFINKKCYNIAASLIHALRETLPLFAEWYGDCEVGYYHYLGGDNLFDMATGRGTHTWVIVHGPETVHCDNWWSPRKCQRTPIVSAEAQGFGSNSEDMMVSPNADIERPMRWVLEHNWPDAIIVLLMAYNQGWQIN